MKLIPANIKKRLAAAQVKKRAGAEPKRIGLYVHLPFCKSKCDYCDFCSDSGMDAHMGDYQRALLRHMREFAPRAEHCYVGTVYFGGGTPTHYGAKRLLVLFEELTKRFKVTLDAEVSLEANPESCNLEDLRSLRNAGFNRVSLGVQSFSDRRLAELGRAHTAEGALNAIETIRGAGFDNLNLDLMFGLPSQSRLEWAATLNRAIQAAPEHISAYGLTVEPGTPLAKRRKTLTLPDGDDQADMYLYAADTLAASGYEQYEISNFARKGYECRHNLDVWRRREYAGFGASAASYFGGMRFKYIANAYGYIDAVESGGAITIPDETYYMSLYEQASEYVMLGLRCTHGISRAEYEDIYKGGFEPLEDLFRTYIKLELAVKRGDRYSLTPKGMLLQSRIVGELLDAQAERRHYIQLTVDS